MVVEPVNHSFVAAVNYRNYSLLKKSSYYGDAFAHDLHKMVKRIEIRMKDPSFPGEDPTPGIIFLQEIKSACDACRNFESAAMSLFEQFLAGQTKAAVKA